MYILGLYFICLLPNTSVFAQQNELIIQEWAVPWEKTRPRDPFVASDGKVWFVGQAGHYAASFDIGTETFNRIDLPTGAGPHNLIVDSKGSIWYTGNKVAHIGRIDPQAPREEQITQFPTPIENAADPHTLIEADDGMLWFTSQWGNSIGRLDPTSGNIDIIDVPTSRARPYGIDIASDGKPWVVLLGTNKLAHIDPTTLSLTEIELPRAAARPRRIGITSDDLIWYVDYAEGYVGHFNPKTQSFSEWPTPGRTSNGSRGSGPYAMTVDANDRIWFVETFPKPNQFVGFDPKLEEFINVSSIPSGGGVVRHMHYDQPSHSIWFGTDTNNLGRAQLPTQ